MKKRALEAILHWLVLSCLYMYLFAGVAFVKQYASLIVCFLVLRWFYRIEIDGQYRSQGRADDGVCLSLGFKLVSMFFMSQCTLYV